MSTAADIPLLIISENASSERRISPAWSVAHLKGRLEPITGIPASCQHLNLNVGSQTPQTIEAADENATELAQWPLQAYAEIHVGGTPFSIYSAFFVAFRALATREFHAMQCRSLTQTPAILQIPQVDDGAGVRTQNFIYIA